MQKFLNLFLQSYRVTKFDNNFIPALICFLLRKIDTPEILGIRQRICNDLISKRKDPIVWNYDDSGVYPDDLDDIFSALIAIHFTKPEFLTGENFIKITKLLGNAGPYQTWLYDKWHDVDAVVNSTIGYFLSLYKINLPPLTEYIDSSFDSKYYTNPLVKYYFISRGYSGIKKQEIIAKVESIKPTTLLDAALRFTILLNLGEKPSVVFEDLPLGNDLYLDKGNVYKGCDALTYAFCLEVFSLVKEEKPTLVLNTLLPRNERFNKIFKVANTFDTTTALGWIAYSLYDDVADGDAPVETIYEANEVMVDLILDLKETYPHDLIKKIFTRMHKACIWEIQNCRNIDKLPHFKKHYSGEKSLGFIFNCPTFPTNKIVKYYREYLELKQLNDDAHDWKEDLNKGHITHANIGVARYIKKGGADIDNYYWNTNMLGIIKRYKMHIRRLQGFEFLKENVDKMHRILLSLERERDYFLKMYKS
jgi:hypothetical protein